MNHHNLESVFISLMSLLAVGQITYVFGDPLTYNVIGETVKVKDCNENAYGALVIPSNVSGKPVTSIGVEAFLFCSKLTSVTIPESVTNIEHAAFSYCDSLMSFKVARANTKYSSKDGVLFNKNKTRLIQFPAGKSGPCTIPESVTSMEDRAFLLCWSLKSIQVAEGNTKYSSKGGILFNKNKTRLIQFPCGKSGSCTIPESVKSLGSMAFDGCWSLKGIEVSEGNAEYSSMDGVLFDRNRTTLILFPAGKSGSYMIPEGVTNIRAKAFWDCRLLTSVRIGKSVTSISYGAFAYCRSLTRFDVGEGNTEYSSIDGVLFDKKKIRMIQFPTMKSGHYTLPESVTSIGESAFSGCSGLTSLIIPESVKIIGDGAFKGCSGLTRVTIPESVNSIGRVAFDGCINLKKINFEGNAPSSYEVDIFSGTSENAKIIVNQDAMGFGKRFAGLPVHVLEKSKINAINETNFPFNISFRTKEGSSYEI